MSWVLRFPSRLPSSILSSSHTQSNSIGHSMGTPTFISRTLTVCLGETSVYLFVPFESPLGLRSLYEPSRPEFRTTNSTIVTLYPTPCREPSSSETGRMCIKEFSTKTIPYQTRPSSYFLSKRRFVPDLTNSDFVVVELAINGQSICSRREP